MGKRTGLDQKTGKGDIAHAQELLSGKWSILILHYLAERPYRFNELQRQLPTMTQATLSKQLKVLEARGMVTRKKYDQKPPKVEYSPGPVGRLFLPVLGAVAEFGEAAKKLAAELPERDMSEDEDVE